MSVSRKIIIDLTESMAKVDVPVQFQGEFQLDADLLQYPNAKLEKILVDFDVTFENPIVFVEGEITCVVSGLCDRCLQQITHKQFVLPFQQEFFKDFADDDSYVYCDSKLDATKAVQDEIVLSMPTNLLCKESCKGLCPKCGADLNTQQCSCDTAKPNAFSVLKNLKL